MKMTMLEQNKCNWNQFAERDAMWAILTDPQMVGNKWRADEFFATGVQEIESLALQAHRLGYGLGGSRALDFGCGIGRLTFALGKYYDECVGVDIAPKMIELADGYNSNPLKFKFVVNQADNLALFADRSFDFICSHLVLQHMPTEYAMGYISEFLRLVKPSGLINLQMPTRLLNPSVRRTGLRTWLRDHAPERILRSYRTLRYGAPKSITPKSSSSEPIMEMHGIPIEEMERIVTRNGGRLVEAQEMAETLIGWNSATYWIERVS